MAGDPRSGLPLALALAAWLAPFPAGADQGDMVNPIDARPPGLVVLWERPGRGGQEAVGV